MGRNAKIRKYTKLLKRELSRMNEELNQEQKDKLYAIAHKKMINELIYKKDPIPDKASADKASAE
jgi:hypothetical protein